MPVPGDGDEAVWAGEIELPDHGRAARTSRTRRALAPVRVAALRILRRPVRTGLVATGVALATATLVGVSSGTFVMRDRVLHQQLAAFSHERLAFRVDDFGLSASPTRADSMAAVRALGLIASRRPVHTLAFSTLRFQSHLVVLTAVAAPRRWLRVDSGRLPRACRPDRCEVLVVGRKPVPRALTARGLRLVPVGNATLLTPSVLGGFAAPSVATLLVASDVRGLASAPALTSNFRTESWVVPLTPRDVRVWQARALLDREARAQSLLETLKPNLRLTGPDDALLIGLQKGRVGARRMLLVGGQLAALLLGFAVLAAVRQRRTLGAQWRRLEEQGARRSQLWLFASAEMGVAVAAGVLFGALLGAAVAAWVSRHVGVGAEAALTHSTLTTQNVLLVCGIWILATLVLVLAVRPPRGGSSGPVHVADIVAVGALAAAILAASRGGARADMLAGSNGPVTLLLLFPGLLSLAAAILAARALSPCLRLAERGARRSRTSVRLAVLALARSTARTAVAVGFLVVSIGLSLLAVGYRTTLERGVDDEAAYQVPLDVTVSEGFKSVLGPLDAASLDHYRRLAPGVEAYPVLRRYGDVPSVGTEFGTPVVLGLDPRALATVHGWRSDFGRVPPARLAALLGSERKVELAGPAIPSGTRSFALPVRRTGAEVELALVIADPSGKIETVSLSAPGTANVGGSLIPKGGRIVGLEVQLTRRAAAAIAHREAIHSVGGAGPAGTLRLGPLVALARGHAPRIVTSWRGWIGRSGARRRPGTPTTVRYALTEGEIAVFRPREPTDGHPLPLVVSPDVARSAAPGGNLVLEFGEQHVSGHIVAIAARFPGTADGGGSFVLAEESHLQTALDADEPGTGRPIELWLSVPAHALFPAEEALRRPPFSRLTFVSRRSLAQQLRADPLSRAVEIALSAGAVVALALAVAGLWLTVIGDVEDEAGDLYDLEAQGATPGELRGQLRLRAAILAALGMAGGLLLGVILSREVVRLVQVSASGDAPVPPLAGRMGWVTVGIAFMVVTVAGAILVERTVRRAFREDTPRRSGEVE